MGSQANTLFTPKEALNEGYFTDNVKNKDESMRLCIDEANKIHPDSMEAYLSEKYLNNGMRKGINI